MKIVRVLWGVNERIFGEVPDSPIFGDEIAVVWGKKNNEMLIKKGYGTILMSDEVSDPEFNGVVKQFGHKILALSKIEELYGEYLFLDWDVIPVKNIDESFYSKIREGKEIQCPLYSYPEDYAKHIYFFMNNKKEWTEDVKDFIIGQHRGIKKYHWRRKNDLILPCFCFFYSRKKGVAKELLKISREKNLVHMIDEFAFFLYADCSLDDFLERYEPTVIRGKDFHKDIKSMDDSIKRTNSYIDNKIKKDLYLLHDT